MKELEYISIKKVVWYIFNLFKFGLTNWKILIVYGFIGGVLGLSLAFFMKPTYQAKLSFIINDNESTNSFSLSSISSIAGIGGIGGSASVNEDKMIFLATSRSLLGETLLDSIIVNGKKDKIVNHYIDIYEMQNGFKSDTSLADFICFKNSNLSDLSYQENKILDKIIKILNESKQYIIEVKKKSGIVAQWAGIVILEFHSKNEELSKQLLDNLYINLGNYYTNKTIKKQLQNYNLIKKRADSLQVLLYNKEELGAEAYDRTFKSIKMQGKVEVQRSKRDIEMIGLMYSEVIKNLEVAKFSLDNQTPVFQLIDSPTYPLKIEKLGKLISLILGSILFSLLTLLYLLIRKNYPN
jgi:uncharacterized protein involved in exopolysaccharide biosynthesis